MPTVRVTARQWPRVLRERLKADRKLLAKAAGLAVARAEAHAVELTDVADKVNLGTFKWSWSHRKPMGRDSKGRFTSSSVAVVGNDAPYAAVIEYGRRPGAPGPPLDAIREWVATKLVRLGEVAPEDVDRVAFLVRRAVHQRGTRPSFIMRDTARQLPHFLRSAARSLLR